MLEKRTWVYAGRPASYQIAGCACGNTDPEWSEYMKHLWCEACQKDFIPEHGGLFDGPIPVNTAALLGYSFARVDLKTGKVIENDERSSIISVKTG